MVKMAVYFKIIIFYYKLLLIVILLGIILSFIALNRYLYVNHNITYLRKKSNYIIDNFPKLDYQIFNRWANAIWLRNYLLIGLPIIFIVLLFLSIHNRSDEYILLSVVILLTIIILYYFTGLSIIYRLKNAGWPSDLIAFFHKKAGFPLCCGIPGIRIDKNERNYISVESLVGIWVSKHHKDKICIIIRDDGEIIGNAFSGNLVHKIYGRIDGDLITIYSSLSDNMKRKTKTLKIVNTGNDIFTLSGYRIDIKMVRHPATDISLYEYDVENLINNKRLEITD